MPKTSPALDTKRLSLTVPLALYEELERVAASRQGANPQELLRSFLRLGLMILQESDEQPTTVVLRKGDKERELFLL